MAANKIIYGGRTLIDLTEDTATEGTVLKGKTFHKADGTKVTGMYESPQLPLTVDKETGKLIYAGVYVDFESGNVMYPSSDPITMSINSAGELIIS